MKDEKISGSRLASLHPKVKDTFRKFIEECEATFGITLRITQGLRTFAEQDALAKQIPKVTNAKGGQSYHNYGLAIDVAVLEGANINWNYDMAKLVPIATKYGITWGGSFKSIVDKPHFEITFGHKWQELKVMHDAGNVDANGYVLI